MSDETVIDERAIAIMLRRPMLAAYLEDLRAGRLDEEQVARAIAGDYRKALDQVEDDK